MINNYIQETGTHLVFIGVICIIISDIIIKIDSKLLNILRRTTIEKELFSVKFTLFTLALLFILQLFILELNSLFIIFENYNS